MFYEFNDEYIRNLCFLDFKIENENIELNSDEIQLGVNLSVREEMVIPSFIYYSTNFILKSIGMDGLFQRHGEDHILTCIKISIETNGIVEAIGNLQSGDSIELCVALLHVLKQIGPIIPIVLHPALKCNVSNISNFSNKQINKY